MDIETLSEIVARTSLHLEKLAELLEKQKVEEAARREEEAARAREFDKLCRKIDRITGNIGGINNRLGMITEILIIPGIRPVIGEFGHVYDRVKPNKLIKENGEWAEVDLFLDNCAEAMAVEVKTNWTINYINTHLERLKKIRQLENNADIKEKALYGAIAGITIDECVGKYAMDNGLYVIKILEDDDKLEVETPPPGWSPRTW